MVRQVHLSFARHQRWIAIRFISHTNESLQVPYLDIMNGFKASNQWKAKIWDEEIFWWHFSDVQSCRKTCFAHLSRRVSEGGRLGSIGMAREGGRGLLQWWIHIVTPPSISSHCGCMSCTVHVGLGCDKELGDDADITNCCDQGSAIMQPLFPSPPLFQKQTHDNELKENDGY